jgi:hypothetical protein
MQRVQPPPFSPDIWTSLDIFWEVLWWVAEEGMSVEDAVNEATVECQDATDQLWETFDTFGQ